MVDFAILSPGMNSYTLAPFESTSDGKGVFKESVFKMRDAFKDAVQQALQNSADLADSYDEGTLGGFMTSVGEQNAIDREYNSSEALKQREWQEEMLQAQMDFNSAEAAANREWQSKESALSRSWQQAMSDSSFTRAVLDLKKAGLNPILAAQRSGASTGSGGMATGGSAASVASTTGSAASSSGSRGVDIAQMVSALGSLLSGAGNLIGQFTTSKVSSTITKK